MNKSTSRFWFRLIITMLFSYCCGGQWNWRWQKWRRIAGDLDCHGNAVVQRGAHHPIEHVQGFTGSHCMPAWGECLHRTALVAAMVNQFIETTQNTNKTQLLASNYSKFWELFFSRLTGPTTYGFAQRAVVESTWLRSKWQFTHSNFTKKKHKKYYRV